MKGDERSATAAKPCGYVCDWRLFFTTFTRVFSAASKEPTSRVRYQLTYLRDQPSVTPVVFRFGRCSP